MRLYFISIILLILFSSCVPSNKVETKEILIPSIPSVYPIPENPNLSGGYPAPLNLDLNEFYPIVQKDSSQNKFDFESPKEGYSAIKGKLFLKNKSIILSTTTLYLTLGIGENHNQSPVILIGPSEDKGDYVTSTNNNGLFFITDIKPGSYYLVASSTNNYSIIEEINGKPLNIKLEPNQILDLGEVLVSLP